MFGLWAKMLHILVLCPVLLIAGVQTLTIDSQLGTSIEDCFERISIGEQLPPGAIYRNVSELTTRECEQICKQDKQCQAYDYGVGAKGNATCDLSTLNEKEVKEKNPLTRHPDFDIYVRRFQCEQSPPTPIQTLLDDPEPDRPPNRPTDRPQHKPVFRPDVDDRPLSDYLVSSDLDPYNSGIQYRPDDVSNRPNHDVGPSYGDHRPQDLPFPGPRPDPYRPQVPYRPDYRPITSYPNRPNQDPYRPEIPQDPYRPERPQDPYRPERPQDPYRPERPPYRPVKPKPDSNDILQFDDYGKPGYLGKPDPYRPEKPFKPENYIIKPNRKPRPDDYKPSDHYGTGPIGPPHKPMYSYESQYASNYGQNDNSVYVEIHDPPRPYVPIQNRPGQHHEQGFLGYGTYSSQNSYAQNSYIGSITEIEHDRPQKPFQKPQDDLRPGYGKPDKPSHPNKGSYDQNSYDQGYVSNDNKRPNHQEPGYQRPNDYRPVGNQNYYGSQNGYGGSHSYDQFGSSHSGIQNQQPLYDHGGSSYQKPQKPIYDKPSYGDKGDYGNQGSYGGHGSYGGNQGCCRGTYLSDQGHYNSNKGHNSVLGSYGIQESYGSSHGSSSHDSQSGYGSQSYGHGSYGNEGIYGESYGSQGYGFNQGNYGSNQGIYGSYGSGYGSQSTNGYGNRPVFDYETHKPGYGNEKPAYDHPKPQKPLFDKPKPGYGDDRPDPAYDSRPDSGYNNDRPSYGNNKPSYNNDKPGYGNDKPSYDNDKPSYGNNKPSYSNDKPGFGNDKPSYGNDKPSYGNVKPSNVNDRPGYGNDKPSYSNDAQNPGYGNSKPDYDEKPQDTGYGPSNSSYRPEVKPVYEYEMDKPTNVPTYIARPGGDVVTSRPVVIGDYEYPVYKDPGMSYSGVSPNIIKEYFTFELKM